ncbi:sensor histidine kinase [Streptomyces sp. NPDC057654]|uniref:sensor histidine kinase n=1 Tax=Streptomyces sp. NPDC057654 TaxID=3346196 RepID=UPI003686C89E
MGARRSLLNWRSLRWKIALLVTVACCGIALTVGLLVHRSTYAWSMNDGKAKARDALDAALAGRGGARLVGPEDMPAALVRTVRENGDGHLYDESHEYQARMWFGERTPDGLVATSIDMGPDQLSRRALDRHMWKYSLVALAVIVPLSALAAELPNRRLRRVARTARRITSGDLAARTGTGGRGKGDEITEISATVDSMADSLQDRLRSEQRFTADVAHELRTPLMGLVTSAELIPESEATDLVRGRVRVLRTLVEDLLEISRLDAGAEHADLRPIALPDMVRDSLARTGLEARLTADTAPPAVVETDPRRLDRILANLIVNAHRHGAAPVEITVEGTTVVVRDHGPGFPDALLAEGPQRFRTGAAERGRGHGLGLTIASGQAKVIGATLVFSNAAGGGAVAMIWLPPVG